MDEQKLDKPKISIDTLKPEDIETLRPIVETWVRSDGKVIVDEVEEIMTRMRDSIEGTNGYTYLVARNENGEAIGTMAFRKPEEKMLQYVTTKNPAELVNAFVSDQYRGIGVGTKLIFSLFDKALRLRHTEVIWNSGPRYKETAWNFYDSIPIAERIALALDYYDKGRHAPIWRVLL